MKLSYPIQKNLPGPICLAVLLAISATAQNVELRLPTTPVCYDLGTVIFPDATRFIDATLNGVPDGFSIRNGLYPAWCWQVNASTRGDNPHCGTILRDSLDSELPIYLQGLPWGSINYLLNHKQGTAVDVQYALWYLTDGYPPPDFLGADYYAMVNNAAANPNFVPGCGEKLAVILDVGADVFLNPDPNYRYQGLLIEISLQPGTRTPGYWKNHPLAWPVDSLTLGGRTIGKARAIAFMRMLPSGDKTYSLISQLIAAKLNVLACNDSSCIAEAIADADDFLSLFWVGSGVQANSRAWQLVASVYTLLDQYNNGLLCAPPRD